MVTRNWGKALLIAAMIFAALLAAAAVVRVARAAEPEAKPAQATRPETDPRYARMREHMRLMQSQLERLANTQDPKERQRLLDEHWSSMQDMMGTMQCNPEMMGEMMHHRHGMMMRQAPAESPPPRK